LSPLIAPCAAARTSTTTRTITHLFMALRIIDPSWFVRWRASILGRQLTA
jgi:hypothetical protein